jgi:hypothetical protein
VARHQRRSARGLAASLFLSGGPRASRDGHIVFHDGGFLDWKGRCSAAMARMTRECSAPCLITWPRQGFPRGQRHH